MNEMNAELCIKESLKKIEGKTDAEKRLEAERVIKWCLYRRRCYIRSLCLTLYISKSKTDFFFHLLLNEKRKKY